MSEEKDVILDEANAEVKDYSCPNCEAALKFIPEKQVLHCDYCDFEMEIDGTIGTVEHEFLDNINSDSSWNEDAKVVHCDNCGANTVVEELDISFTCPFCGSNSVLETKDLPGIKPHRVVPFKIGADLISQNYSKWLKRKFFVPKKVKDNIPKLKLHGVYLPVWTFDAKTLSLYKGRLGKHYTTTVGSGDNKRTVVKTRYFYISGKELVDFDDLIVNAGSKITQDEINAISPFDTNNSYNYEKSYLVGFSAEHYATNLEEGWNSSKRMMKEDIRCKVLSHYMYDVISYLNINTTYNDITYKYCLLPIWTGVYSYNNKKYRFIANGETGKVSGKTPISPLKVTFTVLACLIVVVLLIILFNS